MIIRFKFSRRGPVRYLGHLDMMRYFQKVVMKAGVSARYSEGFHPHQLMSFAYPLGVGMETDGDYMDLEMEDGNDPETVMDELNAVMNEGVKISAAVALKDNAENAMAAVSAATYELIIDCGAPEEGRKVIKAAVSEMLASDTIMAETKKSSKNIRPGIFALDIEPEENVNDQIKISMFLSSGSKLNVRPADLFDTLLTMPSVAGSGLSFRLSLLRRLEIFGLTEDGRNVPLDHADVL
ncbi:MAG: TIGR03936 family radical SAM-associated protein [Lachnospiraceae bacterium]|nr:TIGR03936 family radical SAM-associated protein [Lachnospiraceae bacterium]